MIEKCPKCGRYTFTINRVQKRLECLNIACGYREPVDVDAYLRSRSLIKD
jgi:ribosomal protein S27AE